MPFAPLADVQRLVLDACDVLEPVDLPIASALGHVLAAAVFARDDIPPFDNTAMDGFAVRAADCAEAPTTLEVLGVLAAGQAPTMDIGPGQALRIMTGAPMPGGADAVVMVERTETLEGGRRVRIDRAAHRGEHVRPRGSDVTVGSRALEEGTALTPAYLGLLASVGATQVSVHRRPRVGVLSTGDELVEDGEALGPGQIRDSNRRMLLGCLERDGVEAIDLGIIGDDEEEIGAALEAAVAGCDAVITSGGVSVGDFDHVKTVLDKICSASGGSTHSLEVAIKPAKPFAFGIAGSPPGRRKLIFGLPGNPVSSLVSYEMLARPALRALAGHRQPLRPVLSGRAGEDFVRSADGKLHLLRVTLQLEAGVVIAKSAGAEGSHQLAATAAATGLALVPDGNGLAAGDPLDLIAIAWP